MRNFKYSYLLLSLITLSAETYALPFNVVARGVLPETILPGQTLQASYLVTNTTSINMTGVVLSSLPPNVTFNPAGSTCASTTALLSHRSCVLNLNVTGPVNRNDSNNKNHLFVCMTDKVTCAGPNPENSLNVVLKSQVANSYAYVTNSEVNGAAGTKISVCSVNQQTNLLENCFDSGQTFNGPAGIAINSLGTMAYISNYGEDTFNNGTTVTACSINQTTRKFDACTNAAQAFTGPAGIAINPVGNYAYVSNFNNGQGTEVFLCSIIQTTGNLGTCQNASAGGTVFSAPNGISINQAGTYAYITDFSSTTGYNGSVQVCPIQTNGKLGTCTPTPTATYFYIPVGVTINPAGTYAYVSPNQAAGGSNQLYICKIDPTTGFLTTCSVYTDSVNFNGPGNVAFNVAGTIAYIANNGGANGTTVTVCNANPTTGALSGCKNSGQSFNDPKGLALLTTYS